MSDCATECAPTAAHAALANFTCSHWLGVVTCATLAAHPFGCDCALCCTAQLGPAPPPLPPALPPVAPPVPEPTVYATVALGGLALLLCLLCAALCCGARREGPRATGASEESTTQAHVRASVCRATNAHHDEGLSTKTAKMAKPISEIDCVSKHMSNTDSAHRAIMNRA